MNALYSSVGIEELFVAKVQPDDSYLPRTLPMWAGRFLKEIEELFGPRDSSYCLLGIDFHKSFDSTLKEDPVPMIWYPVTGKSPQGAGQPSRHIIIHLSAKAIGNPELAEWQLAHECVHLIDPWNPTVEGKYANVLEEGLATWYQCQAVTSKYLSETNYIEARDLVLKYEPSIFEAVKNIRQCEKHTSGIPLRIGDISPDLLSRYCTGIEPDDAHKLCETFGQ